MVAATFSRDRLRGLARLGRSRRREALVAGSPPPSVSFAAHLTDASSIGEALGPRPRAASPRPGTDDLMAATIF